MVTKVKLLMVFVVLIILSAGTALAQSTALIDAAKKEAGTVVAYGSLESDTVAAIKQAFQNNTGLELEYWRASATKVMDRALSEYRAGKPLFDVVLTNTPHACPRRRPEFLWTEPFWHLLCTITTPGSFPKIKEDLFMAQHVYKPQEFKLSGLKGISDRTLETHFTLYEGYVKNTNTLTENLLEITHKKKVSGKDPAYAELTRRLGFEYGGMVLHEYYFENLAPNGKGSLGQGNQRRHREKFRGLRNMES